MVTLYKVGEREKVELRLLLPFRTDGTICGMGKRQKRAKFGKGNEFISRHSKLERSTRHSGEYTCPERKSSQPPILLGYLF